MNKSATIFIGPSLATMPQGKLRIINRVCSAEDPEIKNSAAFRQGRIDSCLVNLNTGKSFPSGLYQHVQKAHEKKGWTIDLVEEEPRLKRIKPEKLTDDILSGITLWEHQRRSILAGLNVSHGHVRSGTGSGKSQMIAVLALLVLREHGEKSLVIGGSKGTAYQLAEAFKKHFGDGIDIGFIGDGRKRTGDITVAVPDTLGKILLSASRGERLSVADKAIFDFVVKDVDALLIDETQRVSAAGAYLVAMCCNARRKIGYSGTPLVRKRLRDLKMIGATGPRIIDIPEMELIDKGLVAYTKIAVVTDRKFYPAYLRDREQLRIARLKLKKRPKGVYALRRYNLDYAAFFTKNPKHNRKVVVRTALWFADRKLPCLILCRRIDHFSRLRKLLEKSGVAYDAITGHTPTPERTLAKKRLASGAIKVLLATDIFSRGEDIPVCRGLILAEGVKSFENLMQRIGRSKRAKKTGVNEAWVLDCSPPTSSILSKQGDVRIKEYKKAGYAVQEFPLFSLKRMARFFEAKRVK